MTMLNDPNDRVHRLVLFFDFCSSTAILEDLLRSENEKRWRDLLITVKNFLRDESRKLDFEMYKFIGDGWILLFDPEVNSVRLFLFLKRLCKKYDQLFKQKIEPVLSIKVKNIGITFGIDSGTLVRMLMKQQDEYIGRPLNVAARLQGAINDKDPHPQGKVLMSNKVYAGIKQNLEGKYKCKPAKRTLKNISGGKVYLCTKLWLFDKPTVSQGGLRPPL